MIQTADPIYVFYLEVDPVDSIADVLEHALVGHEEVAVFETSFTAEGGSKDTHVHSRRTGHIFTEGF